MLHTNGIQLLLLAFAEMFDWMWATMLVVAPFNSGWNASERFELNAFKTLPSVSLETVTVDEMTWGRGGRPVDLGVWRGPGSIDIAPLNTKIQRTLPAIWRMRVADPSKPLDISARVIGDNGRPNLLSHIQYPSEEIHVDIASLSPEIVESDGESFLLEGGLSMVLYLDDIRFSGTYTGTVVLTINHL